MTLEEALNKLEHEYRIALENAESYRRQGGISFAVASTKRELAEDTWRDIMKSLTGHDYHREKPTQLSSGYLDGKVKRVNDNDRT